MVNQRELDAASVAAAVAWMKQAFEGKEGPIVDMLNVMQSAFANVIESYEEELRCLKRAQLVDSGTQTSSLPAPVDSAED